MSARKCSRRILLAGVVLVLAAAQAVGQQAAGGAAGPAQEQERFAVDVRLEPSQQKPGGSVRVIARFDCAPEHYLYREALSVQLTAPSDTKGGFTLGPVSMPEAKTKYDKYLEKEVAYFDGRFQVEAPLSIAGDTPPGDYEMTITVGYRGCGPKQCYLPTQEEFTPSLAVAGEPVEAGPGEGVSGDRGEREEESARAATGETARKEDREKPAPTEVAGARERHLERFEQAGFLGRLALAFLAGLLLALTPCIYPMIPITVGVIGATAQESRLSGFLHSLLYVLGIALTYAALGAVAAVAGQAFGSLTQNPAVYIVLAVVFVLLAGAMLDVYVIQLPSSWAQKWQGKLRGKGGVLGVFLMGLLSGLVATPCIAPPLAALLLWISQQGSVFLGFLVLFVVAWGMGVPLVVLGTFTGLARSLPKAGGWTETVKHALGVVLLGVAVYFVGRSGLLPDFWFSMLVAAFLLTVSVFAGAFDALDRQSGWAVRARKSVALMILAAGVVAFVAPLMPAGAPARRGPAQSINWVLSEEEGVAMARRQNKPVMIDFRADWCPECIRLEEETFTDPRVVEESRRFVCVKIDTTDMPAEQEQQLHDKYDVAGYPHIEFLDSGGRRLPLTINEFVVPEGLLKVMRAVE